MATNPSTRQPPPAWSPNMGSHETATIYFRRSPDGVSFDITPVYMFSTDAMHAVAKSPSEYSLNGTTWAPWQGGYNNSAVAIGGRGRLLGATVRAD